MGYVTVAVPPEIRESPNYNPKSGNLSTASVKIDISGKVVAEVAETDDLSRRIYDSWFKFRENALSLSPYSTHGFMTSRDIYKNSTRG